MDVCLCACVCVCAVLIYYFILFLVILSIFVFRLRVCLSRCTLPALTGTSIFFTAQSLPPLPPALTLDGQSPPTASHNPVPPSPVTSAEQTSVRPSRALSPQPSPHPKSQISGLIWDVCGLPPSHSGCFDSPCPAINLSSLESKVPLVVRQKSLHRLQI